MSFIRFLFIGTAFFLFNSSVVLANLGDAFGFGSRTESLAGAGVAWGFGAYSAYSNPAGLALVIPENRKTLVTLGLTYMQPQFLPIDQVYVENNYVSDKARVGSVDTSYRSTFGESIGLSYRFLEKPQWAFGVVTFLPVNQVAFMDTGEAFYPEYILYRARTQRPQVEVGVGGDLTPEIHLGLGMHFAFSLTANATVFLNSDSTKPSTMRFSSSIQPKAAPYLGVLWTPMKHREHFLLGAVLRFPASSDTTMVLKSGARLFGTLAALDFNFTALSALFYDPLTVQLGSSWEHAPGWRLYSQIDYGVWSSFRPSPLQIQSPDVTSCTENGGKCGFSISPGKNPMPQFRNTLVPRVAEEITFSNAIFRIGYGYQSSILSGLPTEAGNALDPPKHLLTAGVGFHWSRFLGAELPAQLDFNAAYHQLVTQHIQKTPGNEAGALGDEKIGAPGYDAGGKIWGGGVSLSLSI